jgi:predicted hotdog family 3-hydroxylacyl-ACP dehydratase
MNIAKLVPHHGSMCLLDRVVSWDSQHIQCETERHTMTTNPLRRQGSLPAICGVEFALQAMALHGAFIYRFAISVHEQDLLSGQAAVILPAMPT